MTWNEDELMRNYLQKRGVTFKFCKCLFTAYNILNSLSGTILDAKRTLGFGLCFEDHTRQMILLKTIISYDGTYQKLTEILKYFINIKNIKNKSIIQINVNIIFYRKISAFPKIYGRVTLFYIFENVSQG